MLFKIGFRLTWRLFWPWRPIEPGWLSLLFFHVMARRLRLDAGRSLIDQTARQQRARTVTVEAQRRSRRDESKQRSLQPGIVPRTRERPESQVRPPVLQPRGIDDALLGADPHAGVSVTHRFYGSRLIFGTQTVLSGLSTGLHTLEITPSGQMIVDNQAFPHNPTDAERIRAELLKR